MHAIEVFAHLWSEDQLCRCRGQERKRCVADVFWRLFQKSKNVWRNPKISKLNAKQIVGVFFLITSGVIWKNRKKKPLRTALHVAAQNNDVDGICRLLEWGADVNICDHKKRTPIHLAAMGGHTQVRGGGVPDICADHRRFSTKHLYVFGLVVYLAAWVSIFFFWLGRVLMRQRCFSLKLGLTWTPRFEESWEVKGVNWDQQVAKDNFVCFLFSWSMGLDMRQDVREYTVRVPKKGCAIGTLARVDEQLELGVGKNWTCLRWWNEKKCMMFSCFFLWTFVVGSKMLPSTGELSEAMAHAEANNHFKLMDRLVRAQILSVIQEISSFHIISPFLFWYMIHRSNWNFTNFSGFVVIQRALFAGATGCQRAWPTPQLGCPKWGMTGND